MEHFTIEYIHFLYSERKLAVVVVSVQLNFNLDTLVS